MNRDVFYLIIIYKLLFHLPAFTQQPVKEFTVKDFDSVKYSELITNKKIPVEIVAPVLIALSYYPELKDKKIVFQLRNRKIPLSARPSLGGVFRHKKNRKYIITISNRTKSHHKEILFHNLPFNAKIGVMGHELAHIVNYNSLNTFQLIGLGFKMFNSKYVDQFEYNTDLICINRGLGYQLLSWSIFVRQALDINEWRGVAVGKLKGDNERYMNPETILHFIEVDSQYMDLELK